MVDRTNHICVWSPIGTNSFMEEALNFLARITQTLWYRYTISKISEEDSIFSSCYRCLAAPLDISLKNPSHYIMRLVWLLGIGHQMLM